MKHTAILLAVMVVIAAGIIGFLTTQLNPASKLAGWELISVRGSEKNFDAEAVVLNKQAGTVVLIKMFPDRASYEAYKPK